MRVEAVTEGLLAPWRVDWTSDGVIIFSGMRGPKTIPNGTGTPQSLLFTLPNPPGERVQGVAADPNFETNNHIYAYRTYDVDDAVVNKLVRYGLIGGAALREMVLIDGILGDSFHNGGRIQFGPDRLPLRDYRRRGRYVPVAGSQFAVRKGSPNRPGQDHPRGQPV